MKPADSSMRVEGLRILVNSPLATSGRLGIRAKRRIACRAYLNPQAKASLPF